MVIQRMEERVLLLKLEVEGRGFKWGEDEQDQDNAEVNGHSDVEIGREIILGTVGAQQPTRPSGGSLGDEELARRLREQIEEDEDEDEDENGAGVHL